MTLSNKRAQYLGCKFLEPSDGQKHTIYALDPPLELDWEFTQIVQRQDSKSPTGKRTVQVVEQTTRQCKYVALGYQPEQTVLFPIDVDQHVLSPFPVYSQPTNLSGRAMLKNLGYRLV